MLKKVLFQIKQLKLLDYLLILGLLLAAIFLYKYFNPQQKWIEVTVFDQNVFPYQASAQSVGDFEKNSSGKKIAEITEIKITDIDLTSSIEDSQIPTSFANKNIFLKTKILVNVNPRNGEYEFKNKVIKISSPIEFYFNSTFIKGTITEMEGISQGKKEETKIVTLRLYGQYPWLAESIKVSKNEKSDRVPLEIVEKKVEPAESTTTNANGQMVKSKNPRLVDITLKTKMRLEEISGNFYYQKTTPIIVGRQFYLRVGDAMFPETYITRIE